MQPPSRPINVAFRSIALLFLLLAAGCATPSTVETRRQEKTAAYQNLPADQKVMVDTGQIRVGMNSDAVYIAWGKPSEILESEDTGGRLTTWHYYGAWMQESRHWAYREVNRGGQQDIFLERHLVTDFQPRDYVRSEIIFQNGQVKSWRTLPRPTN